MRKIALLGLLVVFISNLCAEDFKNITLVRVYDGDTFFVNIDGVPDVFGKEIGIRVMGVDTPELRGSKCDKEKKLGYKARDRVIELMKDAKNIDLMDVGRDKYFRILADVYIDQKSLSKILIDEGLAYEYHGGKKESWCN